MGVWRYSMAAIIVIAAVLDVVWWVPSHRSHDAGARASDAPVSAHTPRCRK